MRSVAALVRWSPQRGDPSRPEVWPHPLIRKAGVPVSYLPEFGKLASTIKDSNMAADIVNTSTQPELAQTWPNNTSQSHGVLLDFLANWSTWQYVVTFLLSIVVYDQGNQECHVRGYSTQLTPPLVMYIKRKGAIAGPSFKIPLMGPFLQALHPKFEAYLAQWESGPLSCVSIFHKYVLSSVVISESDKPVRAPLLTPYIEDSSSWSPTQT